MANTTNFAVEKPTVGGYRNSWGGTLNTGFDKLTELLALALPVGTIQMYPKATAPTATTNGGTWLVCDGSSKVRTDYPDLHTLITNSYGTYPSGTTFLLPDLRSRVPVGYNTDSISGRSTRAIALGSGTETHTLLDAEIPKHTHPITDAGHPHNTTEVAHTHTGTVGSNTANVTIAPNPHSHTTTMVDMWTGAGTVTTYAHKKDVSKDPEYPATSTTSLTATDSGHVHSVTGTDLGTTATALTIDDATTGITVNIQGSGDGSHNIMQPYLVVNYIILAKHPTF